MSERHRLKWLTGNAPENPKEYRHIIIDDSPYFRPEQMDVLIRTSSKVGITADDAIRAKELLKQETRPKNCVK